MTSQSQDQSWEVRDVPGKGKGVFARKDLKMGEEVWFESPFMVFRQTYPPAEILKTLNASSVPAQLSFLGLTHRWSASRMHEIEASWPSGKCNNSVREEIAKFLSNRVLIPTNPGGESKYAHVFAHFGSRLNHSCVPNCWISWDEANNVLFTYAIRDIKAGEELVIFYDISERFYQKREARIQETQQLYDFTCNCPACDLTKGAPVAKRREDLAAIFERIFATTGDGEALVQMYCEVLELMDSSEDGYIKGHMHTKLGLIYGRLGQTWDLYANKYAKEQYEEALKIAKICFGMSSEMVQGIQQTISRVEQAIRENTTGVIGGGDDV